jgi:hypothetical protein
MDIDFVVTVCVATVTAVKTAVLAIVAAFGQ